MYVLCLVRDGVCPAAQCDPRSATAGRTPTQNALVRWSIHIVDKTRPSRLPVDRRRCGASQAGSYAYSRPTAHTQRRCTPRKCKHAVDCCIRLNLNFFTKRHATRVIYRLTVQTLPDGLETQLTPPATARDSTVLSCRAGGVVASQRQRDVPVRAIGHIRVRREDWTRQLPKHGKWGTCSPRTPPPKCPFLLNGYCSSATPRNRDKVGKVSLKIT